VVFLFPGQGGQHVGMARDLYRHQPAFASAIDECAELASVPFGLDLRTVLYPTGDPERASQQLATMALGQVTVFVVEYALVQLLGAWGGSLRGAGAQPRCVRGGVHRRCVLPPRRSAPGDGARPAAGSPGRGAMLAVRLPEQEVRFDAREN